ncbi:MAG TPA: class I adenylate-forming enzyme family protein [Acidimicrobiia bacterium]|nr:class I adenylate-forming enzyme family protein [Acidimicrobiia bacterium]
MNVAMILEMAADALGDRVAFGNLDDGLTYGELRDAAKAVARRVAGDHEHVTSVALMEPLSALVPATLFGAAWAGVTYAPLNFRQTDGQLNELLDRLQPTVVAAPHWIDEAKHDTELAFPEAPERPAILLFTSGSSAAPKAAILTHTQLMSYIMNTLEPFSAGEDEAAIVSVPPFHIAGVAAVLSSTWIGRRIVPFPHFNAQEWIETVRREGVTHATVVPTMLDRIVRVMENDPEARVPSLRNLAYGGARIHRSVLERALQLMPEVDFVNAYGLTETASTVALLGPDDHRLALYSDEPMFKKRLESVGQPIPGIEIRIIDESGAELEVDCPGEILIRGAQVSGQYVDVASKVDADGWLHTGDRGWVDLEGYLFCEGRDDDTIIRGGENISPAEVEDALLQHDAIETAAVVGLPDEEWGERIAAMLVLAPGVTELNWDNVRAFVRELVGSLKTPELFDTCDELPQTGSGKVLRRQVRDDLVAKFGE